MMQGKPRSLFVQIKTLLASNNCKYISLPGIVFFISFLVYSLSTARVDARFELPELIDSPEQAYEFALQNNPELKEKKFAIISYQIDKEQADRALYPRLNVMTFAAPVYKAEIDKDNPSEYSLDYYTWGPVFSIQGNILQPLYTFGRKSAGQEAATYGEKAARWERSRKINEIRQQIWQYYWAYHLAVKILDILEEAQEGLKKINQIMHKLSAENPAKVSIADRSRLKLFSSGIKQQYIDIENQKALALHALERSMGLPMNRIQLSPKNLRIATPSLAKLESYLDFSRNRPEWKQIKNGIRAFIALKKLKESERNPIFGIAAQFESTYSTVRDRIHHPGIKDPYNQTSGGVGIGFMWNFDFAKSSASVKKSENEINKLRSTKHFAELSIPLEIHKAYLDLKKAIANNEIIKKDLKTARRWARLAQSEYETGTLQVKDFLEGLATYLKKRAELQQSYYQIRISASELARTIGKNTILLEKAK